MYLISNLTVVLSNIIGTIDRAAAERLLLEKTSGSFLVRLSRRTWGYTVSVRGLLPQKLICLIIHINTYSQETSMLNTTWLMAVRRDTRSSVHHNHPSKRLHN